MESHPNRSRESTTKKIKKHRKKQPSYISKHFPPTNLHVFPKHEKNVVIGRGGIATRLKNGQGHVGNIFLRACDCHPLPIYILDRLPQH